VKNHGAAGAGPPTRAKRASATLWPPTTWVRTRSTGHIKTKKDRTNFLEFCRYLRTLYPPDVHIAIVMDNFSPHLSTKKDTRVGDWAQVTNVELAYVPTNASWLNRIEAQFQARHYVVRHSAAVTPVPRRR
jgi:transposase